MAGYLSLDDRNRLADELAGILDLVGGSIERRNFLKYAGLDRFLPGLPLGDQVNPTAFTQRLVSKLEDYGTLPEDPRFEALGKLLAYVVSRKEYASEVRASFARLIVRYDLVSEPEYIATLREEFKIDEAPKRQAPGVVGGAVPLTFSPPPHPSRRRTITMSLRWSR